MCHVLAGVRVNGRFMAIMSLPVTRIIPVRVYMNGGKMGKWGGKGESEGETGAGKFLAP